MTSTGQSVEGTPQRSRADIESERAAVKLAAEKQEYERSCGLLLNAEAVRLTWSQHTEILQHALKTHPSKSARAICLALNLPMSQAATIEAVLAEQTDSIRDQLISATGDDDGEEQDQAAGPA